MNTLIVPGSGQISFSQFAAGSDELPPLSASARIAYTQSGGGLTIVSTSSSDNRFNIEGFFGNLLTVTDAATGSIFNLNDISGFKVFEVYDTGNVVVGKGKQYNLVVSGVNTGLGINNPQYKLTVKGPVSGSGLVYASGGNSDEWNLGYIAYTNLVQNSGNFLSGAAIWDSVYNSVHPVSSLWNSNYTSTSQNSANWDSVYLTVSSLSASWEESAEILPTVTNYLSTNNVLMLSATIMDSLSVAGTIYTSVTADAVLKFNANIGNGVGSSFNVIHNFNTKEIIVSVYDNVTNVQVFPIITVVDFDTVNLQFSFVPSNNAYCVIILGTKPSNRIAAYGNQTITTLAIEKYQFRTTNFNIVSGYYAVDTTSGPVRGTLPSTPSLGDTVAFIDTYETWSSNNFVVVGNGNPLDSLAEDLSANISGFAFKLTWTGGAAGWRIY